MRVKIMGLFMIFSATVFSDPGDAGWSRPSTCSNLVFQWDGSIDANPALTYSVSSGGNWRFVYSGDASVGSWESPGVYGLWTQTFVSTNTAPTPVILNTDFVSHFNTSDETGNCMKFKVLGNDPATDPTISRYQMVFNLDVDSGKDEGYFKYNMKLPGNIGQIYTSGVSDWGLLAEWRYTGDYSFRMGFYLSHGTVPAAGIEDEFYYKVQIEQVIDGVKTYPIQDFYCATAENFIPGDYLEYEFYYKYDKAFGELWVNVDGKELCKYSQINTRPAGITPSAFHCPKVYTSKDAISRASATNAVIYEIVNFMEIYTD